MNLPNHLKVQVELTFKTEEEKPSIELKEDNESESVDLTKLTLESFRIAIHELLTEEIADIYKSEEWKQEFITRAKNVHNYTVQSYQLSKFVKGEGNNESLLLIFLKELYLQKKQLSFTFTKNGELNI